MVHPRGAPPLLLPVRTATTLSDTRAFAFGPSHRSNFSIPTKRKKTVRRKIGGGWRNERAGSTLYSYMNDRVKMDQVAEETSYDKRCTDRLVGWMCTRVHTQAARLGRPRAVYFARNARNPVLRGAPYYRCGINFNFARLHHLRSRPCALLYAPDNWLRVILRSPAFDIGYVMRLRG